MEFLEESFLNIYVNECHESEPVRTASNRGRTIIDANRKKADLNKAINEHSSLATGPQIFSTLNYHAMLGPL